MACTPTRLELSNSATTTVQLTLVTDPGDGTTVTLEVDGLGIAVSGTTTSAVASFAIAAVSAANNSIWDATVQVGTNRPATVEVVVTETNTAQTVGMTITDADVTYCAPSEGGGVSDHGLLTGLSDDDHTQYALSRRIDHIHTLGMTVGAYRSTVAAGYSHAAWVTWDPNFFTSAGLSTQNEMATQADADAWAAVVAEVAIQSLAAQGHKDGVPIIIDPEDAGVDVSLHLQDMQYALNQASSTAWNPAARYPDARFAYAGNGFSTDWSTAYPLVIDAMVQVQQTVRQTYPRSPIGWAKTGPAVYLPGWIASVAPIGDASNAYEALDEYFSSIASFDTSYTSWRILSDATLADRSDFAFMEMYQDTDGGQTKGWFRSYGTNVEKQHVWWHLVLKYYGRDSACWNTLGKKLYWGPTPQFLTTSATDVSFVGKEWSVSEWASDVAATGATYPSNWQSAGPQYHPDYSASILAKGQTAGPINNPRRALVESLDLYAWLFAENQSDLPVGYQTLPHLPSAWAGETAALSSRVRDLNIAIWDPFFIGERTFSTYSSSVFKSVRDSFADGTYEGTVTASDAVILQRVLTSNDIWDDIQSAGLSDVGDRQVASILDAQVETLAKTIAARNASAFNTATTSGTVTSVGLTVPSGFTVSGSPVTSSGTLAVSTTLDGILKGNGAGTISGDAELNDLANVNVAPGAGNDGNLVYYDWAAGSGSGFKGIARSSIALSEFNDDLDYAASSHTHAASDITSGTLDAARLPAISDSYLMLIEAPSDKDYTLDARVAAGRTVTNFFAKTSAGTCTATLKNLTDATTIGTISVTSTGGSAASLSNTTLDENDRVGITIGSTSSAEDLEIVVEYTQ